MIHWDPSINLGTVMGVVAVLIPLWKLLRRQAEIGIKVDLMWGTYERRKLSRES